MGMTLGGFTAAGMQFRDVRTIGKLLQAEVLNMLVQASLNYPPVLFCKGGTSRGQDLSRLRDEFDTEQEAREERQRLEAIRHPRRDYFGDIAPITFAASDRDGTVGGWQIWGINTLPGSTERETVVRARPFPAYRGMRPSGLVSTVVDTMAAQLGAKFDRSDGGTFEVREWEVTLFRQDGGRGDGIVSLFQQAYLDRDGFSVQVTDDTHGRTVWRIRNGS